MRLLRLIHLWIGLVVSAPLFCFSLSGLLYALPGQVDGGSAYAPIDAARVRVQPGDALAKASLLAGRMLPISALTLEQKNGRIAYEAVGGLGADSITIDAESGIAVYTAPPDARTRFFRQAHFFFFAGRWQVPLLCAATALSCVSILSGVWMAIQVLRRSPRVPGKQPP